MAFGLSIVPAAYGLGAISGAQLTPAVSLGFPAAGRMTVGDFVTYVIAQIIGAIAAVVLNAVLLHPRRLGEPVALTVNFAGDWHRNEAGRTLYIGSATSAVRVRIYEKGIKEGVAARLSR